MRIFIMTHKHYVFPKGSTYAVVGLGGYRHPESDHFDEKGLDGGRYPNKHYCELTGINYVYKNTSDSIVGICHYRRYFNFLPITANNRVLYGRIVIPMNIQLTTLLENPNQFQLAEEILDNYDIIVPRISYSLSNIGDQYVSFHGDLTYRSFLNVLDVYYGPTRHSLRYDKRNFFCNMLLCKRSIFDTYCSQLFSVIDRVYKDIGTLPELPGARYQPYRYPGYLAERFMTAFINANKLKFFEADIICTEE